VVDEEDRGVRGPRRRKRRGRDWVDSLEFP
jgi:hypothetical protein